MVNQDAVIRCRQSAHDLLHEQLGRVWRGAENLYAPGGQIDDKHRIERDETLPRPHFGGKEIRARDCAPVRPQEGMPRGRTLRDWRQPRRLQDPANRRAAHAMANVLERALDPRVTPCRILCRHPHDELPDFEKYPAPTSLSSVRPLPRNQLAMPSQQPVGRRDGRDLPQGRAAHPVCPRRQPSAIVVGQTQPTPAKLATQEPVFFDEVGDRPLLPALQPASQHRQDHLQRCGVDHEPELISRAGLKDVGPVLEHYGVA
jgi:hypothetical protein